MALPANLPNIAHAKLPKTYESAKAALAQCSRIDECKDWADKAAALASYAKQAGDDTLRKTAERIQARAIQRCGALLRAIKPGTNQHVTSARGSAPPSRAQAARDAGLSRDQKRDALRVAKIPADEFDRLVESDDPPTLTDLAKRGTASKPLVNLGGRDPQEYAVATQAIGHFRRFAEFVDDVDPRVVLRGAKPHEHKQMARQGTRIIQWIEKLLLLVKKENS